MPCMSTVMIWQTSSTSSADTERLGELLGKQLAGGEVIELRSDLGGGKTTFVIGLARGTGSPDRVSSPSFTLNRIYNANNLEIHHFDFYRLDEPGILQDQLAESLNNPNVVVVVEWADIVKEVLPESRLSIELNPAPNSPEERRVTVSYPESQRKLIARLQNDWNEAAA